MRVVVLVQSPRIQYCEFLFPCPACNTLPPPTHTIWLGGFVRVFTLVIPHAVRCSVYSLHVIRYLLVFVYCRYKQCCGSKTFRRIADFNPVFLIKTKTWNWLTIIGFRFIVVHMYVHYCTNLRHIGIAFDTVGTGIKYKVLLGEIEKIRILSLLRIGIRITGSRASCWILKSVDVQGRHSRYFFWR